VVKNRGGVGPRKSGLMIGDNHGNLILWSPITREQFITALYRCDEYRRKTK